MDKVQLSCLILGIIICLAGNFVHSWAVDGYYECCCKDCSSPVRGTERGCFPCRSKTYHCDCVRCSCFPSPSLDQNDDDDSSKYISFKFPVINQVHPQVCHFWYSTVFNYLQVLCPYFLTSFTNLYQICTKLLISNCDDVPENQGTLIQITCFCYKSGQKCGTKPLCFVFTRSRVSTVS